MTLFEASDMLGGRARCFRDPKSGLLLDNCQHVLLGCCSQSIGFLRRLGTLDLVEFHKRLIIAERELRLEIRAAPLPAPLHLLPSILTAGFFNRSDQLNLIRVMAAMLARRPEKGQSADEYLTARGCGSSLRRRLLEPTIVSALNEWTEEASASYARMVLIESLTKTRSGYQLGVPKVSHAELIAEPATRWLRERGAQVRLTTRVIRLQERNGVVADIVLADGERVSFDGYVAAVPPASLVRLGVGPNGGEKLAWRPIVAAHLFFSGPTPEFDPVCVAGEPFGWVFSKDSDVGYVELVASGAQGLLELSDRELTELALRAARTAEPLLSEVALSRSICYKARQATFATADCDAHRPRPSTSAGNLFLAGDWTDTGWPATIESAVRSGRNAAAALLKTM